MIGLARRAPATALLLSVLALACASPRAGGPGPLPKPSASAREALDALVLRNDATAAEAAATSALARRPDDAWARLAAALLARRALDGAAEVRHLAALAAAAPGDPLALVALRRLSDVADEAPERARAVLEALAPLSTGGRLAGLAAYRARVARITAAEVLGDHATAAALRHENGAVSAWTLAGPFGLHRALEFDAVHPPDRGELPAAAPAPAGLPPRATRTLPAPDGSVTLEGEPPDADVFFLAADVTLATGGRYLATLGTSMSARLSIDGAPVHERRAFAGHLPTLVHVPVELAAGRHRLVVKVSRSGPRSGLHVALTRADGAPSDASYEPAPPGPTPVAARAAATAATPAPVLGAAALAAALEPGAGFALARLLAARDASAVDREGAKALLAEAIARAPASAALRFARGEALADDPTLDDQVARGRAEAELREALARDPGLGAARLALAELLRRAERLDDADALLGGLGVLAGRGAALAARARLAEARGLPERAEALVAEALSAEGGCGALELAAALAARRRAGADEETRVRALASCRDGRVRLAELLQRRGDPRGAAEALRPAVDARPWSVEPALALAGALVAAGDAAAADERLARTSAIWPRSARILKKRAELRELGGDAAAARALREEALRHDGADLALRRAVALDAGREVLDDLAEDGRAAIRAYEAAKVRGATSSAMVLDAAAVEIHAGGAATERTHQIFHVLDQQGVEQLGEVSLPPGAEVLALRTLKGDGRALEPERTGAGKGSVSLAGLEPGDYVEVEHVRAVRGHGGAYVADPFYFQIAGTPLFRSSYVVAAPAGLGLSLDAHGMPAPQPSREGGRELVRAVRTEVPALVPEPGAAAMTEYLPFLQVGTGGEREVIQRSLGDAVLERTRPTEELRALVREIRAAAGPRASPEALARAAYARVAKTILGSGGGFGEDASAVLSRGRGSRLAVLKVVLSELGLRARFALARPFTADPAPFRFASPTRWPQPLLRVEAGAETTWLDPSLRLAPFGAIPAGALDVEAIVLPEPGEPLEVVRTPARALVEESRTLTVRVALRPDGGAELEGTDTYAGLMGAAAKAATERLDARDRRQAVEAMMSRSFAGFAVTEVVFEGEEDPEAPLVIRWRGAAPDVARVVEGGVVVDALVFPARLGARYVQLAARTTPLLIPEPERGSQRLEVVAPEGLAPRAEPERKVDSPFGTFVRSERVEGRTLVREERLELARGRISPERYRDFAAFAAAVDAVQARPVVLGR